MAKVSLRIYNREIGTLVDQGQYNEAIGHCQHILKTFPKNLETYRVLGKAYLEAKVYNDAGDIFSRVLTSVPNDFVAHVGMSMIADEKSKGNEAIWHMQRAFEAQPSNAAVQSELQRLYSRRDGVEPAKIRMTSGALANIYVQGELYAQAIAEIMSVEAQDPGRMDMQVLLANAYFRSGQRVEASQTASDILAKSPYSLDANRILVEILPETSRAENAEVYRQRVNALDPYAAFVNDSVFNADDVPDAAISLERLNWNPENASQLSSRWGDSAGIELDEGKEPDWLKDDEGEIRDPELDSDMEISTEEEDIPDFMRAAGWGDSTGEAEPTSFFDSPAADPEAPATEDAVALDQAEMPDWMKTMAPSDAEESTAESDEEEIIGDDMASDEWINDLLDDKNNKEKSPQESPKSDTGIEDELIGNLGTSTDDQDAAMNWLESLAANQGAKAEELITDPNARTESAPEWVEQAKGASEEAPPAAKDEEDDALDWLNEAESKKEPLADASVDEMPDWMQDSSKEEKPLDEAADENMPEWMNDTSEEDIPITEILDNDMPDSMQDSSDDIEPAAEVSDSEMPDWMQEMKDESIMPEEESSAPVEMENASEAETLISDPAIGELGASEDEQDEAMNWLESLAVNQGAKAEELITDPDARTESAPEWVEHAKEVSANEPAQEIPPEESDDDLAWLNEVNAEKNEASEKPATEVSDDDMPDWMQEMKEEPIVPEVEAPTPLETEDASEAETLISDSAISELGAFEDDQDEAMNWLESLAASQGAKAEELITGPDARTEAASEWIEQAKEVPAQEMPVEESGDNFKDAPEEETLVEKIDNSLPEQLQDVEEPLTSEIVETPLNEVASAEEEIPKWLQDDDDEDGVPEVEEPEAPQIEEELPAEIIQDIEDAPTWIKAMDEKSVKALPPAAEEIPPAEGEDLPSWLNDLDDSANEEEKKEIETSIPESTKTEEEAKEEPQPTQESEWKPVEMVDEDEALPAKEEVKVEKKKSKRQKRMDTTMLRDVKLIGAQAALDEGNISAALEEYGALIKKNRLLDEVIYDLREALDDYPIDISITQMLGDAYMRAGRLQDAIDTYTNAENLLR